MKVRTLGLTVAVRCHGGTRMSYSYTLGCRGQRSAESSCLGVLFMGFLERSDGHCWQPVAELDGPQLGSSTTFLTMLRNM